MTSRFLPRRWAGLLAALLLSACATVENPVTGRSERTVMDVQSELAAGAQAHKEVLAEYGEYPDAALQAYVRDLGQRLARHSHRSELAWQFTVVDSADVNAFALPGGYIYVTRGLMAYMESEGDLAGVLAHEIGHVTARHASQRVTRQQAAGIGVFAASVLGAILESRGVAGVGDAAAQVSQGVAAGYVASYGRGQELQADQLGAEYLARAGYDPRHMLNVLGMLRDQERFSRDRAQAQGRSAPETPSWLASHPSNEQRLQEMSRIAAGYAGPFAQSQEAGRTRYLQRIDGLVFGDSAEQGLVRGQQFYHVPLGFALTAPARWSIHNARDALTLSSPESDAAVVLRMLPPQAAGATHEQILRRLLPNAQGRMQPGTVNGLASTRFSGTQTDAQGRERALQLLLVTAPQGRHVVLQRLARDAQAMARAGDAMGQAENSFRVLSAQDRAAARPWVIRTLPMPAGGVQALARQSPLDEPVPERLRLLNGLYGSGTWPAAGRLVKTVQ